MPKKKKADRPKTDKDSVFSLVNEKIQDAIANTQAWENKQPKWHKLRMRIKKEKTFPFEGCSNIRMPTAETYIRKIKASILNGVFGIRPVVQVIPPPSNNPNWETARKIEKLIDHLVMDVIQLKPKAVITVDQALEKGFQLMKPYWRVETTNRIETFGISDLSVDEAVGLFLSGATEDDIVPMLVKELEVDMSPRVRDENEEVLRKGIRALLGGKEEVKFVLKDVLYDFPDVALVSPERCYVPSDSGWNPQDCAFIAHEMFLPLRQIFENAYEKGWDLKAVEAINAYKELDPKKMSDIEKDMREGIERLNNPSELVRIWECYGWFDLDGDGVDEKVVITLAPDFHKTLRKITLPYKSGRFPFVKFFYELLDDRWFHHRGVVEIMEDIIKEIDVQHMQKLDQQTVRNSPMFLYRAGMVNPNLIQFIPNQAVPVHGANPLEDTVKAVNLHNPNVEFSYEREEQILNGKAQELIGQIDYTLQSMINRRQPRTLGEVSQQQQAQQLVFSLDAEMNALSFSELFNWIWELWNQFGPEEYEFAYFGQEGYQPVRLTREEVQGKWTITVRGNDRNTNPQVRLDKAQMILQMSLNPIALQTGVVSPQHIAEAYKRAYQELEIPQWELLVNAQPQPQQGPVVQQPQFRDLAPGEQAQVLAQSGIRPDMESRLLDKQMELAQIQSDHQTKLARGANNGQRKS